MPDRVGAVVRRLGGAARRALYEQEARIAWQGGVLSWKDRLILDQLAAGLGLGLDEALGIEARILEDGA